MDKIDLTNKVAIITGASSGIGAETAKMLSEYNAKLTIIGRDHNRLYNVAQQCEAISGYFPLCLKLDLTKNGSCKLVIDRTIEIYGRIDILINSAGQAMHSSIFEQNMEGFDKMITINLRVPFELTQLALPHLIKTKGNIINVGSYSSKRFRSGLLPYIVAKTALEKFTTHAAADLATKGVRVNMISPGVTRTNFLSNFNVDSVHHPYIYKAIAPQLPSGTIIEPREVAILICFTASGLFPNVSGSNFLIDGGASVV